MKKSTHQTVSAARSARRPKGNGGFIVNHKRPHETLLAAVERGFRGWPASRGYSVLTVPLSAG